MAGLTSVHKTPRGSEPLRGVAEPICEVDHPTLPTCEFTEGRSLPRGSFRPGTLVGPATLSVDASQPRSPPALE